MATSAQTSSTVAASAETLTFDGIAKHFNMAIGDAANALGVCQNVLKTICRDNGLQRWPYRKFLAGKSIEEIQKDAARERKREMIESIRASKQKQAAASTISPQQGNNPAKDGRHNPQQQGNNPSEDGWSNGTRNIPAYLDEFKQGFPSNGLSTVTVRWWGSDNADGNEDEMLLEDSALDEVNNPDKDLTEEETDTKPEKRDWSARGGVAVIRERASCS